MCYFFSDNLLTLRERCNFAALKSEITMKKRIYSVLAILLLASAMSAEPSDGEVVFSTFVYIEGDIELPGSLSGTYTIHVLRGSQTFEGEITL